MLNPSKFKKRPQRQRQCQRSQIWPQQPVQHREGEDRGRTQQPTQQQPQPGHAGRGRVGRRQQMPVAVQIQRERGHRIQGQNTSK